MAFHDAAVTNLDDGVSAFATHSAGQQVICPLAAHQNRAAVESERSKAPGIALPSPLLGRAHEVIE